jgi:hypothetical protein
MKPLGIPFSNTPAEEESRSSMIMSLQTGLKPTCCITSRRNGQDTESKTSIIILIVIY